MQPSGKRAVRGRGGLTGLVKKPGSSNNFDTFYQKGTLKVQQAPGAVGYLFGDMVKDGIYQQAYYHGPSAAASELTGRLAGNSTFEAAVEEGFQPYQGEAPLQFGQSKTYTVKELVPEGYEASYVTAGDIPLSPIPGPSSRTRLKSYRPRLAIPLGCIR